MNIKIIVTFFYFLFLTMSILIFIYILILNNAIYFFERRRCKYKQLWACTLSLYQEQITFRTSAELSLSVWFSLPAPMISIEQDSPHFIDVVISQHSISEWDLVVSLLFLAQQQSMSKIWCYLVWMADTVPGEFHPPVSTDFCCDWWQCSPINTCESLLNETFMAILSILV